MRGIGAAACAATAIICLASTIVPTQAENCTLHLLASLKMRPDDGSGVVVVPGSANGSEVSLIIDTGSFLSTMSPAAVKRLGLELHPSLVGQVDTAGHILDKYTELRSFALGNMTAKDFRFMVDRTSDPGVDGSIGPDILTHYDADFDFGAGKFNLISQDHCPGQVVYWPATSAAVVPVHVAQAGHIIVPVVLDGVKLKAEIDTGASLSSLNASAAEEEFHIKGPDAESKPVTFDPGIKGYTRGFKQLTIGGIGVSNPTLVVMPDKMAIHINQQPPTGSLIVSHDDFAGLPDVNIGDDVLRHLHLYVAYREEKLYITPAEPPKAAASAQP